jgi:cytidine deaminase
MSTGSEEETDVRVAVSGRLTAEEGARLAWQVRENARILGKTAVGCAAVTSSGQVFLGCNVEHGFRSHDVHAEVNAIGTMVASGHQDLVMVVVAAARDRFSPCGACLDWIFEFGGPDCVVAWQGVPQGSIETLKASDLMPFYPC